MSSSAERGPGRPPGYDPDTVERIRRVRAYESEGLSLAEIASLEGCSVSYVKLLKRAPATAEAQAVRPRKPPALRLTERAVAHHAVLAMRRDTRLRAFEPGKKLFWLDVIMEIHALGDVDGLAFGSDGDAFETHADFAVALGGKPEDLEHFLRRGLLARLPDGGIDLPTRIGLKPKERPRSVLPGSGEQPLAQPFGVSSGGSSGVSSDDETGDNFTVLGTGIFGQFHCPEDSEIQPISLSSVELARAAAAAAKVQTDSPFSEGSSSSSLDGTRASGADSEMANFTVQKDSLINSKRNGETGLAGGSGGSGGRDSEIPEFHCPPDSLINPKQSGLDETSNSAKIGLVALTAELVTLAGFPRPPNAEDLGTVRVLLEEGISPDEMRLEIASKMADRNGLPPRTLRYFGPGLRQAHTNAAKLAAGPRSPPAAPRTAPEPEPPEQPIVGDGPDAQWARVQRDLRKEAGGAIWHSWLADMTFAGINEDEALVCLPTRMKRDWVNERYGSRLSMLWHARNPDVRRCVLDVAIE